MNSQKIQNLTRELLIALGEDPDREGLKKTPERVAKSYSKLLEGYTRSFASEITVFENVYNYNNIISSGHIDFVSLCEHHLLPFAGYAHIGYIPNEKIIGLSKLSRVVDIYTKRLQDQERITIQVANEIMNILNPKGVVVLLTAKHLCNIARGVEKKDSNMTTIIYRGVFEDNVYLQQQFFDLIKISNHNI